MKEVIILIGPKGSGKTYIGREISRKLKIPFVSTEKIFISVQKGREIQNREFLKEGYEELERKIDEILEKKNQVIFETTGTFEHFSKFLKRIKRKYSVKMVRVHAPLGVCLKRIEKREQSKHIAMSKEKIRLIYYKNKRLKYKVEGRIDTTKDDDEGIIKIMKKIS